MTAYTPSLSLNAPAPEFTSLEQALKHYFGYDEFRPGQREIIEAVLDRRDLLVIMPTGGGKSMCFQLPALLSRGLTIVVSPLIALMQDQVEALQDNGIGATFLNSTVTGSMVRDRVQRILSGEIKLLYVAPERLLAETFLEFLHQVHDEIGIATFAIDEAHCVSEWGHDFRPEYRQLRLVRDRFPSVPVTALTATATERVRQDIAVQLRLQTPLTHIASFNRRNLYYEVRPKQGKQSYTELLSLLKQNQGSGIIYCLSRKKVDELTYRLQQDGIEALPYHAGLTDKRRAENQRRFIRDDVRIMVATIAFGMGINKPDVRTVIHYDVPKNLEGYYQESGRAGRDNEAAKCILFFSFADVKTVEYLIDQKIDPTTGEALEEEQQIARQQLRQVIDYAEGTDCRRQIQLSYFGEWFEGNCDGCDNCLQPKPIEDWTLEAQKFLSCVARVKERFGMKYVIDVLRGSKEKRILGNRHNDLSTYGIGRDRTADEWKVLGRSLLHQGLIDETTDGYAVLRLNHLSWEILRKQRTVEIAVPPKRPGADTEMVPEYNARSEKLFKTLRSLRKAVADEQEVAPYIVFSDSSLKLMASLQPQTLDEFAEISGVGSHKLTQYGDRFVEEIRNFCIENNIPLREAGESRALKAAREKLQDTSTTPLLSSTHLFTFELHQRGMGIDEIAEKRELKASTIVEHLTLLLESKRAVNLDSLVSVERQVVIQEAIDKVGDGSLKVIREMIGEEYSYEEIRLVRAGLRGQAA
jgi:ATP-dependent DNA helicase RecQ